MSASARRWAWILPLTIAVTLPSVVIGFYADDYVLRDEAARLIPYSPPTYDLYNFTGATPADNRALVDAGILAWWTSPGLRIHLLRPLTSLLLAGDLRLFGAHPLGYHIVSLAWYLGLVAAVAAVFRRILAPSAALIATIIFAIDPAHVSPWGWIACRHMSIAAAFSVLSLLLLIRARQRHWPPGAWLSALALAFGFAGGETALGGVGYALAYALLGGRADEPAGRRAALIAPVLGVTVLYLALYMHAGGGAAHGGAYVSPFSEPLVFAAALAARLPAMLADATVLLPADLASVPHFASWFMVAACAGIGALLVLYAIVRPLLDEAARLALRWLVPGSVAALVVTMGGFPGSRLRLMADVGFAAVFGVLLGAGFARAPAAGSARLWTRRTLCSFFAVVHLGLAPLLALASTISQAHVARSLEAVSGEVAALARPEDRIFVLVASDPFVAMYPPSVLLSSSQAWAASCWSVGSMAKGTHRVTRTGPSTLLVEALGTTLLEGAFELLYRSRDEPLRVGDRFTQCGASYRVDAAKSGRPTRIELTLDVPLEDSHIRVLAWQDGHLRSVESLPIGHSLDIAWSPGPVGML
jgi:hypothetical protein